MPDRLRFAFAITSGPNRGLACAGWRIWTKADSTYITAKPFGGIWKVSLHGEDSWRLALTKENESSDHPMFPSGHRNAPWIFEPTQFQDGGRLAFAIQVSRNSLIPQVIDPREAVVEVADRWDRLTTLYVWMTEEGIAIDCGTHRLIGGPLPLTNGTRVWVTSQVQITEPYAPEPIPSGLMVEPLSPRTDNVSAPGLNVRGVNLSYG